MFARCVPSVKAQPRSRRVKTRRAVQADTQRRHGSHNRQAWTAEKASARTRGVGIGLHRSPVRVRASAHQCFVRFDNCGRAERATRVQ